MEDPLVTAVMITGKHQDRIPLALASIAAFQGQTYPDKQLLILNTGQTRLTDELNPIPNVFETFAPHWCFTALGLLRNHALDIIADRFSPDAWVIQWDDDDWHHPHRIAMQVYTARENEFRYPVTLRNQIRYSFETNSGFEHKAQEAAWGIHGTVLHPQTDLRYEQVPKHEDSRFLKLFKRVDICENMPQLYIRFVHGRNTFNEQHIMRHLAGKRDVWDMSPEAKTYLADVLNLHYIPQLAGSGA